MSKLKTKDAFTLVELLVSIAILSILGTISFMSLQGFSQQARDSSRISDLSTMKTALELFQLNVGKYPLPTIGMDISYSGATVWTQGSFGETVFANLSKLDKKPVDPITQREYSYSVTAKKNEYQLGGLLEGSEMALNAEQQANAAQTIAYAYTTGNFNGQLVQTMSGTICNVLAVPSITTSDLSQTDLQQIVSSGSLVYRGYNNLPPTYKGSKYNTAGGFAFTPNNLISYSDTGSCAALTDTNSYTARVALLKGLQTAYSGTIVKDQGELKNIMALSINTASPSSEVINYAGNYVNNLLKTKLSPASSIQSGSTNSSSSSWSGDATTGFTFTNTSSVIQYPTSCNNLLMNSIYQIGSSSPWNGIKFVDGVYWIDPDGANTTVSPFQVYCDMTSDGGGWTLVSTRSNNIATNNLAWGNNFTDSNSNTDNLLQIGWSKLGGSQVKYQINNYSTTMLFSGLNSSIMDYGFNAVKTTRDNQTYRPSCSVNGSGSYLECGAGNNSQYGRVHDPAGNIHCRYYHDIINGTIGAGNCVNGGGTKGRIRVK